MDQQERNVIILRCLAYPGRNDEKDGYYAVCIDTSLSTWRPTLIEAKKSLDVAIEGYLETISDLAADDADVRQLIYRPVPLWPDRIKYHLFAFRAATSRNKSTNKNTVLFQNPVELPLAA